MFSSSLHHRSFFLLFFSILITSRRCQQQLQTTITSFSASNSPWRPTQNQTLLSPNSAFAAGFLPLPTSPSLYTFSVWFHFRHPNNTSPDPTDVVWSTRTPLSAAASLLISPSGDLRLLNSSSATAPNLWPSSPANGTRLSLSPTGNLAFGDFQSFSNPTNTILPYQPINETVLVSTNGKFKFDSRRLFLVGSDDAYWTNSGNQTFTTLDNLGVIVSSGNSMFSAADFGTEKPRKLTLDNDGNLRLYSYNADSKQWVLVWHAVFQLCRIHGTCGPNSICIYNTSTNSTSCVCPPGYYKLDSSCRRRIPIRDLSRSKFLKLDFVNFTGGLNQSDIKTRNFSTCESECLSRPSCLGFMFKFDGSNYCVLQLGRMVNGYWSPETETAMFLRVDESETHTSNFSGMMSSIETMCPVKISLPLPPEEGKATARNISLVSALFAAELISAVYFLWVFFNQYEKYRDMARTFGLEFLSLGGPKRFSYSELKEATDNFSNEIGKGGFGVVHKGKLSDGRVVAVKSLKNVTGGDADFWAEVSIIARMHHLNLVRLWGFCVEKGSRILVYEYIPNGSLDKFLFRGAGKEEASILDWNVRYRIALGVARAIAYLHEECLEWVLHCDIKPENILVGDDFCPKVSDFGLAKLRKKEDVMSVSRMRGTPGYIAPEWVQSHQMITSKADVYSYGLVLLEIVSGERNFKQVESNVESDQWFFPRWAFEKVFNEMNVEDVLDERMKEGYDRGEHFEMIERMVKTAMWCLQYRAEARPSMGKVAKMLEGAIEISVPEKPTIFYLDDD